MNHKSSNYRCHTYIFIYAYILYVCTPTQLKILRFDFSEIDDSTKKMLLLARETLELAVLFSIQNKDLDSFERHIAQLKPYYYDYRYVTSQKETTDA